MESTGSNDRALAERRDPGRQREGNELLVEAGGKRGGGGIHDGGRD